LIGKVTGAYSELSGLMAVCIAHGQTTAIPLYYAEVLGSKEVTDADPHFEVVGPSYVLIFAVFTVFSNWSVACR
jgi:hypothetical protein